VTTQTKPDFFDRSKGPAKLEKQESADWRSPSPQKANLKQITSLLDDDEECFYHSNLQNLVMARQKSKTEYNRRPIDYRK
jgi:hypothetical protein